jgi:hypothetical protein
MVSRLDHRGHGGTQGKAFIAEDAENGREDAERTAADLRHCRIRT